MELDPANIDPKHLKVSFLPRGEEMSRRDLLFGLLKPKYEIVPAVEADRCAAWRGCSLCVTSCPEEAISLREQSALIDKDKCTACGACLTSCPVGAIASPLLDPEVLDASLESLVGRDGDGIGSRLLLIASEDAETILASVRESLPPECAEFKLPCIGALSPWLLLRAFDLGAGGVVVIPCGPTCRHRCQSGRWQGTIRFVQALLSEFQMEPERLRVISLPEGERQLYGDLIQAFVAEVKALGPLSLQNAAADGEHPNLVALLRSLARRFDLDGSVLCGDEIPFGIVEVKSGERSCTLCGSCSDRCPTEALALREGAVSSQLLFTHSRCVACTACVEVCPEKVLRLEKMLNLSLLGKTTVLAKGRMAYCRRCGKTIAPLTMMQKVRDQLAGRKTSPRPSLDVFCPDCRIFSSLDSKQGGSDVYHKGPSCGPREGIS
jgi:ferredoxin